MWTTEHGASLLDLDWRMDRRELLLRSQELARRQAELDRMSLTPSSLQPGEEPEAAGPDDAEHWVVVYRELVDAKQKVIAYVREQIQEANSEPAIHVLQRDEESWRLELERLQLHLEFWRERVGGGSAEGGDES